MIGADLLRRVRGQPEKSTFLCGRNPALLYPKHLRKGDQTVSFRYGLKSGVIANFVHCLDQAKDP
jgi:hypothetical protein